MTLPIWQAIGLQVRCPQCGGMATVEPAQVVADPQDARHWQFGPEGPRPRPPEWVMLRCPAPGCGAKVYEGMMSVEAIP
jgi:hypothetical protein